MMRVPEPDQKPVASVDVGGRTVHRYAAGEGHRDEQTITSFGEEWEKFTVFSAEDIRTVGAEYFDIVPTGLLTKDTVVLDLGCGSGRWTRYMSPLVGKVEAVDPSAAVLHAARANADLQNVRWSQAGVDNIPFADGTFDAIVCLGVLHHVPDTPGAVAKAAAKLRPGGHMLLYLYYALDGRGPLFKALFHASTVVRRFVSAMPGGLKRFVCDLIAVFVYLPFVVLARLVKVMGGDAWKKVPLSYYVGKRFLIIRNDALDRFGTPLEQRFTKEQMRRMMTDAGLSEIRFSENAPYWHALG
ncbi:MAG: class I SAM-dependent methyltransferase, partial [Flavobacteriales bacterium]